MGRIILPNYPHHIVQRGHNRQVVFAVPEDYQRYLADLRELKDAFGVRVYAYCLMTNHVHLLLAPVRYGKAVTNPVSCSQMLISLPVAVT
jgi:putative transposase